MGIFTLAIGDWRPGIGDPSFMGWFTVVSYYVVALLCLMKAIHDRHTLERHSSTFWLLVCSMMFLLGLQKQFNLFSAFTEIGRIIAFQGGWLEQRRPVQAWAMIVAGVTAMIIAGMILRRVPVLRSGQNRMVFAGLVYLVVFVVLRAMSLHQFDVILNYNVCGVRLNCLAELFAIFWVGLAVFRPHGCLATAIRPRRDTQVADPALKPPAR